MAGFEIVRFERRHILLAVARGVGYLVLSTAFWVLSYWIVKWLFVIGANLWGSIWNWSPSAEVTRYVTWSVMALLGFRFGKSRFDLLRYADSFYLQGITGTSQEFALRTLAGRPLGVAYIISQVLFCAPRFTTRALLAFLSITHFPRDLAPTANAVVADLSRKKFWTPAYEYAQYGEVLRRLHRMGVIRLRVEKHIVQIRTDR